MGDEKEEEKELGKRGGGVGEGRTDAALKRRRRSIDGQEMGHPRRLPHTAPRLLLLLRPTMVQASSCSSPYSTYTTSTLQHTLLKKLIRAKEDGEGKTDRGKKEVKRNRERGKGERGRRRRTVRECGGGGEAREKQTRAFNANAAWEKEERGRSGGLCSVCTAKVVSFLLLTANGGAEDGWTEIRGRGASGRSPSD